MMYYSNAAIERFYGQIDVFLAAFARLAGFFVLFPIFTGQTMPAMTRVLFAAICAVLAVVSGQLILPDYGGGIFAFGGMVLTEFLIGFTVGFMVYVLMSAFLFMGQLVDYQIGFSMVSVFDPITQQQAPVTGNFYYLVMLVFFVQTGTMHSFIYEIIRSFETIPIGSPGFITNLTVVRYIVSAIVDMTVSAVRISLPVVGTILVVDVILGILVKAVPNLNVFVVGMPAKVLVGLIVLYIMAPFFSDVYRLIARDMMKYTTNVIRGLSP